MPIDLRMLRDAFTLARQACPGEDVRISVHAKTQAAFDYAANETQRQVRTCTLEETGQEFDSIELHLDSHAGMSVIGPRRPKKEAA